MQFSSRIRTTHRCPFRIYLRSPLPLFNLFPSERVFLPCPTPPFLLGHRGAASRDYLRPIKFNEFPRVRAGLLVSLITHALCAQQLLRNGRTFDGSTFRGVSIALLSRPVHRTVVRLRWWKWSAARERLKPDCAGYALRDLRAANVPIFRIW